MTATGPEEPSPAQSGSEAGNNTWVSNLIHGVLTTVPGPLKGIVAVFLLLVSVSALIALNIKQDSGPNHLLLWTLAGITGLAGVAVVIGAIRDMLSQSGNAAEPLLESGQEESTSARALLEADLSGQSVTVIGLFAARRSLEIAVGQISRHIILPAKTPMYQVQDATVVLRETLTAPAAAPRIADELWSILKKLDSAAPIAGIAIATPGIVEPNGKHLVITSAGIPNFTDVAGDVAAELLRRGGTEISHLFKLQSHNVTALTRRIFIDNSARSLARAYGALNPTQRDFMCVYLGAGVGTGLYLGGVIRYGSHGFAAEGGHQTVHYPPADPSSADPGGEISRTEGGTPRNVCNCGKRRFHWETLSDIESVLRIAEREGPGLWRRLQQGKERPPVFEDFLELASKLDSPTVNGDEKEEFNRWLASISAAYAPPLAVALSNVVNLLDMERVILSGPIVDLLEKPLRAHLHDLLALDVLASPVRLIIQRGLDRRIAVGALHLWADTAYSEMVGASSFSSPFHIIDELTADL